MEKKLKAQKSKINDENIIELAKRGCTQREIAYSLGCRIEDLVFNHMEALNRGRELGKIETRKLLWEKATEGNSIALRYFIYNLLGESLEKDANIIDITHEKKMMEKLSAISNEDVLKIIKRKEASNKSLTMKAEVED